MANKEYCIRNLNNGSLHPSGCAQDYTYDATKAELRTKEYAEGFVEHRNRSEGDFPAVEALLISDYKEPTSEELMELGYRNELKMHRKYKEEKKSVKVKMFMTGLFFGFLAGCIAALVL